MNRMTYHAERPARDSKAKSGSWKELRGCLVVYYIWSTDKFGVQWSRIVCGENNWQFRHNVAQKLIEARKAIRSGAARSNALGVLPTT